MFTGTATPKLGLPQWNPTDHPDFLTDLNQAFKDIDENASATSQEIEGYPQRLEELETLTQSLNEDTQQLLVDMSSAQVAITNLKTESEKIDPMELQIQGLQSTVSSQGDEIRFITNPDQIFYKTGVEFISSTGLKVIGNVRVYSNRLQVDASSYADAIGGMEVGTEILFENSDIANEIASATSGLKIRSLAQLQRRDSISDTGGLCSSVRMNFANDKLGMSIIKISSSQVFRVVGTPVSLINWEVDA